MGAHDGYGSPGARRFTGFLLSLLLAGCAAVDPIPPGAAAPAAGPSSTDAPAPAAPSPAPPPASTKAVAKARAPAKSATPAAPPAPRKDAAPPPLDLAALEARLRETSAIGMFTKIALKNQVDDLLDRFREHYAGTVKTSLAELRPPYDRLLLKVLAALQDEDPELAHAIVDSREPIWNILADPARFSTL